MGLYKFVGPLGIITYSLLFLTVLSGLMRWNFKYHRTLGIAALVMATIHALIVILN